MPLYRLTLAALLLGLASSTAVCGDRSPEWVAQRVQQWQPTARDRRWEQIGWARDLRSAERLAKEHNRPVFLFTLDGRMDVGRC